MLLYLDASALVKRYVMETGSKTVMKITGAADIVATSILSRAEVVAALCKAIRVGTLNEAVVFATFDRNLWQAAVAGGLSPFPEKQP